MGLATSVLRNEDALSPISWLRIDARSNGSIREPGIQDFLGHRGRCAPEARGQHIDVVPKSCSLGSLRVLAESRPDPWNLVRGNTDPGSGPAEKNALVCSCDGLHYGKEGRMASRGVRARPRGPRVFRDPDGCRCFRALWPAMLVNMIAASLRFPSGKLHTALFQCVGDELVKGG